MKLLPQTKICKVCFKEIKHFSLNSLIKPNYSLCDECYEKLFPKWQKFKISNIDCYSIYEYVDDLKSLIYQYKGCFDVELKEIFLDRYNYEIRAFFHGYTVIPAPSNEKDDQIREFNHVEEAFKCLNLPMIKAIYKSEEFKQSDKNSKERSEVYKYLKLKNDINLKGKKLLLVDDICTTGSTLKACISLLKSQKPKVIKVLVLCKTMDINNIKKPNTNKFVLDS